MGADSLISKAWNDYKHLDKRDGTIINLPHILWGFFPNVLTSMLLYTRVEKGIAEWIFLPQAITKVYRWGFELPTFSSQVQETNNSRPSQIKKNVQGKWEKLSYIYTSQIVFPTP